MADGTETRRRGSDVAAIVASDEELRERLLAYAVRSFQLDHATAEDLLQDALLDILRSEQEIRSPEGFAAVVFRARCRHHVERLVERRACARGAPLPRSSGDDRESIVAAITLREGFRLLSPTCKTLLRARYLEGRSLRQMAAELVFAYSGISTLISRCVRRLRLCVR